MPKEEKKELPPDETITEDDVFALGAVEARLGIIRDPNHNLVARIIAVLGKISGATV